MFVCVCVHVARRSCFPTGTPSQQALSLLSQCCVPVWQGTDLISPPALLAVGPKRLYSAVFLLGFLKMFLFACVGPELRFHLESKGIWICISYLLDLCYDTYLLCPHWWKQESCVIIVRDEWGQCSKGTVTHVSPPLCGFYSTVNMNQAVIAADEAGI